MGSPGEPPTGRIYPDCTCAWKVPDVRCPWHGHATPTPPAPLVHPEVCAFCGIITTDAEPSDGTKYVCRDTQPCIDRARKAYGLPPKPAPRDDQRARDAVVEAEIATLRNALACAAVPLEVLAATECDDAGTALAPTTKAAVLRGRDAIRAALRGTNRPEAAKGGE